MAAKCSKCKEPIKTISISFKKLLQGKKFCLNCYEIAYKTEENIKAAFSANKNS